MKQTKEELLLKIGELQLETNSYKDKDSLVRKEFGTIFNLQEVKYLQMDFRIPSWAEIFTRVGRLLQQESLLEIQAENKKLYNENLSLKDELKRVKSKNL